jgi:ABC-type multidrug transport system permease subunit
MSEHATAAGLNPLASALKGGNARSLMCHPLVQLVSVRMREFVREPEALFWSFAFPILLAGGLGLAFHNSGGEVLKVAVVSAPTAAWLRPEKSLDVAQMSPAAAEQALRTGKVALLVSSDPEGRILYRYDDTNPEGRLARLLADRAARSVERGTNAITARDQILREPGSRYIDFLIPGLLGMTLMGSSMWGMGFAIVDARRRKLLRLLTATPMPRSSWLFSFALSQLVILAVEVLVLLSFGTLFFHVPMRGAVASLTVVCVLGNLCFSGIGLLIGARAQTVQGASGLMNVVMMPMWICSGVFFSAQRFPETLQPFLRALPLTALIDALRMNLLEGAGLRQSFVQLTWLTVTFMVSFGLAIKIFKWR